MLCRLARSSKKALPEKCRRCSEGREVKPLWEPTGTKPGGGVGGREGCVWSLEARQGLGGRADSRGPRLCLDSGFAPGPASRRRLTSLRFGPPSPRAELAADVPVPHVGGFGSLWQRRPPLPRLWVSAPRPGIPSLPDPHCGPAALPPTCLYLLLERAEGVEAGAASSSAQRGAVGPQPFPAAATALSRAALGWREP